MDPSSNQPRPAQGQTPAHRDMMFCHECADEWYRDEHGLTCPECGSDFTEIIEDNNDPRDSVMFGDDDGDDDDSMHDFDNAPAHPHTHPHHNPWANDDPEEGDISNFQFTQTAPGRYNVQATITRSVSPQQFRAAGGMAPASIGGFMSMLNGIAGAALRPPQGQATETQGQGAGLFSGPNQNQSAFQEARSANEDGQPQIHASRFTYHGGARLYPRDANNPEPRVEPVDDIANVVTGLMAALGAPPGQVHTQQHRDGGFEAQFGGDHDHNHPGHMHPAHPFLQLFTSLGMIGPNGQMGDFVYSQEGLDRIVSQLMEQTASSNAPGPAPQSEIDSLPRKKVDEEMLGAEHKAECSICMDEVNIGEEVTMLPCKHWFHHACVSAWLGEHDTCPHCRKGISKQQEGTANNPSSSEATTSEAQATGSRQMPGAFDVSGSGTSQDPFVVPGDTGATNTQAGSSSNTDTNTNEGSGGIGDRLRRGLFGPPQ